MEYTLLSYNLSYCCLVKLKLYSRPLKSFFKRERIDKWYLAYSKRAFMALLKL